MPKRDHGAAGHWAFLRLLGLVYLVAFVSLWVQVRGLVGSDGILPVAELLDLVRANTGAERYLVMPTLLWLADADWMLDALCGAGTLLSLALIAGLAPRPVLVLLWAFYLSLVHGGQAFLSFQWDTLLLETGFCALFVAPAGWRPTGPRAAPPVPRAGVWLLRLLLFKLMFLSGAVKPLSLDGTWWQRTALEYHYWTQPLPAWTSWYADRLPSWFQGLSVWVTYAIEIALPFAIFTGTRGRRLVAAGTAFLMLMIAGTGNYGFFNLLTVVLCVPLLDRKPWVAASPSIAAPARAAAVGLLLAVSLLTAVRELARTVPGGAEGRLASIAAFAERNVVSWSEPAVLRWTAPFRTINGYGLFRAMTVQRPEIVIEGSRDGVTWLPYEFRWKPGDPKRRPRFVEPHMPRLDWQMWFAALGPQRAQYWLEGLLRGLLRGSPDVLGLLGDDPFDGTPPRYARMVLYRYRFATPEQRRTHGVWWSREAFGPMTNPLTLEDLGR